MYFFFTVEIKENVVSTTKTSACVIYEAHVFDTPPFGIVLIKNSTNYKLTIWHRLNYKYLVSTIYNEYRHTSIELKYENKLLINS